MITPFTLSSSWCDIYYTVEFTTASLSQIVTFNTTDPRLPFLSINDQNQDYQNIMATGVLTSLTGDMKLIGHTGALTTEQTFQIEVINPCNDPALSSVVASEASTSIEYYITNPSVTVSSWMDIFGSAIPLCGSLLFYPLKESNDVLIDDATSVVQSFASFNETTGLSLQTDNQTLNGTYVLKVAPRLKTYPAI